MIKEKFTYDDVLLVPKFNPLVSRDHVDTRTQLGEIPMRIPIVSANMDTITGEEMAKEMFMLGGLGILNRYFTKEQNLDILSRNYQATPSIGIKDISPEVLKLYRKFTSSICVDTAHAHTPRAADIIRTLRELDYKTIIAGNVVTGQAANYLVNAGANVIKVGIGPGSVCSTRENTGHGYPQLSAVMEIRGAVTQNIKIIADGGIDKPGDIVKALAAGANAVMLGKLLSGFKECLDPTKYRGMASFSAQMDNNIHNPKYIEGESLNLGDNSEIPVSLQIKKLMAGVRSGFTYSGASNLQELQANAEFVKITQAGKLEGDVRLF